jgi:hypothetical protein
MTEWLENYHAKDARWVREGWRILSRMDFDLRTKLIGSIQLRLSHKDRLTDRTHVFWAIFYLGLLRYPALTTAYNRRCVVIFVARFGRWELACQRLLTGDAS